MTAETPSWKRMRFKGNKVWMALDTCGRPQTRNGKVRIKYALDQDYEYWVHPQNVRPLDEPAPKSAPSPRKAPSPRRAGGGEEAQAPIEIPGPEVIVVYTDGASSGNPGPSGIGVVWRYGGRQKELSRYIGPATNNIAELEAIRAALEELKRRDLPVRLHTDSNYAFGLLTLGWKPRKNQALVKRIRDLMKTFKDLRLIKVRGHAGTEGNERADFLATSAIRNQGK